MPPSFMNLSHEPWWDVVQTNKPPQPTLPCIQAVSGNQSVWINGQCLPSMHLAGNATGRVIAPIDSLLIDVQNLVAFSALFDELVSKTTAYVHKQPNKARTCVSHSVHTTHTHQHSHTRARAHTFHLILSMCAREGTH